MSVERRPFDNPQKGPFMQKITIYLNKRASNTSYDHWRKKITRQLFRSHLIFKTPSSIEELNQNLKEDIEDKVDAIISVGGDGTANTVIQNIAKTEVGLLVIPAGTANDLASELSDPKDIEQIIQCIRLETKKKIDLININGQFMATNGGIGLGSIVAAKINDLRQDYPLFKKVMQLSGSKIYSLFLGYEILTDKLDYYDLELKSPNFHSHEKAVAVLINNQSTLAGSFIVAPETNNSDGSFNVSLFTHPYKKDLLKALLDLSNGNLPQNDPHFKSFETSELEIINNNPEKMISFFGDGEVFAPSNRWEIKVERKALTVYAVDPSKDLVDWVAEVTLT